MATIHQRILIFFVAACAFTWFGHAGNWIWPSDAWPSPMFPLGPLIAAIVVIWTVDGRAELIAWLKRIARLRAPLWVYLIAVAIPIAAILASTGLAALTGVTTQPLPSYQFSEYLIAVPIIALMGPVPEELAFRGHAQFQLQKTMTAFTASIWIGIGVVVWHLPLLLTGEMVWPWAVCIVAVSVVYAWLFKMGGSVWPLALLHFVVNYFGGAIFLRIIAEPDGQLVLAGIHAAIYVALAAIIVARYGPSLAGRLPLQEADASSSRI